MDDFRKVLLAALLASAFSYTTSDSCSKKADVALFAISGLLFLLTFIIERAN